MNSFISNCVRNALFFSCVSLSASSFASDALICSDDRACAEDCKISWNMCRANKDVTQCDTEYSQCNEQSLPKQYARP